MKYKGKWSSKLMVCMRKNSLQHDLNQKGRKEGRREERRKKEKDGRMEGREGEREGGRKLFLNFNEMFHTAKIKPILFYRTDCSYLLSWVFLFLNTLL